MRPNPKDQVLKYPDIIGLGIGNTDSGAIDRYLTANSGTTNIVDWAAQSETVRSRRYQLNTFLGFLPRLQPLILSGLSTAQGADALGWATKIALDFHRQYPFNEKDPEGKTSNNPFAWYDMAIGIRSSILAFLIMHLETSAIDPASKADLRTLKIMAINHAKALSNPKYWAKHSNHGYYQSYGLFALTALSPELSNDFPKFRALAVNRILHYLKQKIGPDGLHLEHSTSYHNFIHRALSSLQPWLNKEDARENEILEYVNKTLRAQAALIMPNGFFAPLGDTDYTLAASKLKLQDIAPENIPEDLLHAKDPSYDIDINCIFNAQESGLFVSKSVRQESSHYFAKTGMFHSRVHKQADDLSIIWSINGCPILTDSGRYGYEGSTPEDSELRQHGFYYSDPKRIFCESAHGHNCVEVDGQTYNRKTCPPYGSALTGYIQDKTHTLCEGSWLNPLGINQRRITLVGEDNTLLILDYLSSADGQKHDVSQWHQLFPCWSTTLKGNLLEAHVTENWSAGLIQLEDEKRAKQLSRRLQKKIPHTSKKLSGAFNSTALNNCLLYQGQTSPRLQGWTSLTARSLSPAPSIGQHSQVTPDTPVCMAAYFDLGGSVSSLEVSIDRNQIFTSICGEHNKTSIKVIMEDDKTTAIIGTNPALVLNRRIQTRAQLSSNVIQENWAKKEKAKHRNEQTDLTNKSSQRLERLKKDPLGTLSRAALRRLRRE